MKKHLLIVAAIVIAAATAITVVSCKKENNPVSSNPESTAKSYYQPPQVDDMLAYLKDFKQKIQVRGNDDTMGLDEASWHLSSLANYDFGNVKNNFTNFRYDTLYNNVCVDNGSVTLSELNTVYNSISNQITAFYQSLSLEDMAPRFIDATIEEDGLVKIALMTSYRNWWDHYWFFPDGFGVADSILNSLGVDYDSCYALYGNFNSELQRVLNLLIRDYYDISPSDRIAYIPSRTYTFSYYEYTDPYGSPYIGNSRVMYFLGHAPMVCYEEFAYLVDSYMGLAVDEMESDEIMILWYLPEFGQHPDHLYYTYHIPRIKYGVPLIIHDDPLN